MSAPRTIYWVDIHVVLTKPLAVDGEAASATGYYRRLGVVSARSEVRALVERHTSDGTIDWPDTEIARTEFTSLDLEMQASVRALAGSGIWYQSGRSFHGPD